MPDQEIQHIVSGELISKSAGDNENKTISAIITRRVVDRDREVIEPTGIKIDKFLENPVLLWSHVRQQPPVGRVENLRLSEDKSAIVADLIFAETPAALEIANLVKSGFLRGVSIGIAAKKRIAKGTKEYDDYIAKYPSTAGAVSIITESELWELSVCTIPANQDALILRAQSDAEMDMYGAMVASMIEGKGLEYKPYPHEHAARQLPPDIFDSFRRVNNMFGDGIDVIFGRLKESRKWAIQSIRFDATKWTVEAAKKWLKDHGYKDDVEPAKPEKSADVTEIKGVEIKGKWEVVHEN